VRPDHLVGILGGMGPAATAEFYAKLIRRTPAARDQDHLRVVIWADPTVPDRVGGLLGGAEDPYPVLLAGASRLRDLGVTVAAMPCHTAHAFLPDLVRDTGLRFVDMVAETGEHLRVGPVGLLGTRGTIGTGLYQKVLAEVEVPSEATQSQVDRAIQLVKQGDPVAASRYLGAAVEAMTSPVTLLACTELPLAAQHLPPDSRATLLDPTDLLADAIIREVERRATR
jgi:aspartate racemase